jgi:hypothetical protein
LTGSAAKLGMHEKNLQLLQIILEATRQKQLVWRSDSASGFHGRFAGLRCVIRFRHLMLSVDHDPEPLADFAEVTVGMASLKFYSGTEGFGMVQEMISLAYPELSDEYKAGEIQLDELLARLKHPDSVAPQRSIL